MPELNNNPTFKELQEYEESVCRKRGFQNSDRASLFAHLLEEVGELASAARKFEKGKMDKEEIELELADVLIFLAHIANHYEIDSGKALVKKEEINKKRIW